MKKKDEDRIEIAVLAVKVLIRSRQIVIDGAICGGCIYRELLSHYREHIQQNNQTPRPRIFDRNSRHGGSGKKKSQGGCGVGG